MIEVNDLWVYYSSIPVLRGVSIKVKSRDIISIVGPNGAGKSTLLKSIIGYVKPSRGKIFLNGKDISGINPDEAVRLGIVYVPERKRIFPELSVEKNLLIGSYIRGIDRDRSKELLEFVFELFPNLRVKRNKPAAILSGGEAQMVAVGRGIMSDPSILLLDEPSLGLAPKIVSLIYDAIIKLNRSQGTTIVIADQIIKALEVSSYGYVINNGIVIEQGEREYLLSKKVITDIYFKYS